MHILYMDESGTAELAAEPKHFVLLGLAIRGDFWKTQDALVESIKRRFDLHGQEIHTAWMARRYAIPPKNLLRLRIQLRWNGTAWGV